MMVWTRKVVETVRSGCLLGNPLAVQWSGPLALTAKVLGSIPGEETKIPQVTWQYPTSHMVRPKKKKKKEEKRSCWLLNIFGRWDHRVAEIYMESE